MEPIRIFVGGTAEHDIPTRVLDWTLHYCSERDVRITRLWEVGIQIPEPANRLNRPRTTFSFQRFLIPEACHFQGRAIYLDSDMIVGEDIAELWESPLRDGAVCATPPGWQSAVMLIDCERAQWRIADLVREMDEGRMGYGDLMNLRRFACAKTIHPGWNSMDKFIPGETRLLHYTNMRTQPWLRAGHPLESHWIREFEMAMRAGTVSFSDLRTSIVNRWVRPSLATYAGVSPPYPDSEFIPPNDLRK